MEHSLVTNHLSLIRYGYLTFSISALVFLFVGWAHGRYRLHKEKKIVVRDAVASTIFGLTALILGFTFIRGSRPPY